MKKIIALALTCFLATLSLTGCGNTNEITELRQRVETLESKISEYENSQTAEDHPKGETDETISTSTSAETDETASTSTSAETDETASTSTSAETNAATDQVMLAYLDTLAKSNNYANWTEVAECEEATETHLLTIAEKCSNGNPTLAQKIADNKATTDAVMEELAKSTDYGVWTVVAESDKSNKQVLLTIAQKCQNGNNPNLAQKIDDNFKRKSNSVSVNP